MSVKPPCLTLRMPSPLLVAIDRSSTIAESPAGTSAVPTTGRLDWANGRGRWNAAESRSMEPLDPFMQQALAQARAAVGLSEPHPRVGCVIVAADGQTVLGEGHTQAAGQAHAEVMALRNADARGHSVAGATAYVTLEPCSHHGRTGPCCDALVAHGIRKVVAALPDPNPLVAGQGLARLRAAGIEV